MICSPGIVQVKSKETWSISSRSYISAVSRHAVTFWGGGIDTQKTLAFGTPEETYEQTRENINIFKKDGGFVFNTIHNVQANVPVENFMAMLEAVREYRA